MEKKKTKKKKVITLTITEDTHTRLKAISQETFGSVNVSAFISYVVHNWSTFNDRK